MTNIYSGRKKVLIDPGRYAKKKREEKKSQKSLLISSFSVCSIIHHREDILLQSTVSCNAFCERSRTEEEITPIHSYTTVWYTV